MLDKELEKVISEMLDKKFESINARMDNLEHRIAAIELNMGHIENLVKYNCHEIADLKFK